MNTPQIKVGIMTGREITLTLEGYYHLEGLKDNISGNCKVKKVDQGLELTSIDNVFRSPKSLKLIPSDSKTGKIKLHNVTIGISFHWERKEDQVFRGGIELICEDETIYAINVLSLEDYLVSVISSEMSATSSMELLKSHAVISRSWLLAQIQKNKNLQIDKEKYQTTFRTEDELIKWYDREDHTLFDVCADDHCQRYQGITRSTTPQVEKAVQETHGEILAVEGVICDSRFSKCCGGITEVFENVWEPVNHTYLQSIVDNNVLPESFSLALNQEAAAREWIMGKPAAFCNSSDKNILKQVLNDFDQETNDFYRWKVVYTQDELSEIIRTRSGIDFGIITDLIPIERGLSARLIKLKIIGTLRTMTIGKELEIRKTLSRSHLYSSAFIIDKQDVAGNAIFTLYGAGWGHGVGLCQIGAAVMGDKGYSYNEILSHYFHGASIEKRY
jgi:stage II sporulation protein D